MIPHYETNRRLTSGRHIATPAGDVMVNYRHKIAQDLELAILFNDGGHPRDASRNNFAITASGSPGYGYGERGICAQVTSGHDYEIADDPLLDIATGEDMTIMMLVKDDSTSNSREIAEKQTSPATWQLRAESTAKWGFQIQDTGSTSAQCFGTTSRTTDRFDHVVGRRLAGVHCNITVNAAVEHQVTDSTSDCSSNSTLKIFEGSATGSWSGQCYYCLFWKRYLHDAEVLQLYHDIKPLFIPRTNYIWVPPVAAGGGISVPVAYRQRQNQGMAS